MSMSKVRRIAWLFALALVGCTYDESEEFGPNPEPSGDELRFIATDGTYWLDYEVTLNGCDGGERPSGGRSVDVRGNITQYDRSVWLTVDDAPSVLLGRAFVDPDGSSPFQVTSSPAVRLYSNGTETSIVEHASPTELVIVHTVVFEPSPEDPGVPPGGCRTEQRWVLSKVGPPGR